MTIILHYITLNVCLIYHLKYYQKDVNHITLNRTTLKSQNVALPIFVVFVRIFVGCESFLESNYPDILTLCKTNLDDSIHSGNFSVRSYLPLIRKGSTTHIHGLAVYVKTGLTFARDLSLENTADSFLYFRLALLHSVSYFFFLYRSPSLTLWTLFDAISSNINEFLSINSSAVFFFGGFNVHHKD